MKKCLVVLGLLALVAFAAVGEEGVNSEAPFAVEGQLLDPTMFSTIYGGRDTFDAGIGGGCGGGGGCLVRVGEAIVTGVVAAATYEAIEGYNEGRGNSTIRDKAVEAGEKAKVKEHNRPYNRGGWRADNR